MATIARGGRRLSLLGIYLAVLLVAFIIVAVGATVWLSIDTSGTNALATDEKAISHTP